MSTDADLFRAVLGRFATGVTIVTARDTDGRDHGMTVSAFSSLSLDPPLVLVCIDVLSTMAPIMHRANSFAVNILRDDHEAISRRFADDVDDRFADLASTRSALGHVWLTGAVGTLDCRIVGRHPAGDHVIVVGEVQSGAAYDGRPLLYFRGGYTQLER